MNKARFSFQKVLDYLPQHSMANTALAIIELSSRNSSVEASSESCRKAVDLLQNAFKSDVNNPLAVKLIADHYFNVKNFDMAQGMCEHGMTVLGCYRKPDSNV